jgi:ABC-2 type transport system permease protein
MNLVIIRRYLRDRRVSLAVFCFAALAFAWMYVALFPSLKNQMTAYQEIFKSFPSAMMEAMGISDLNIGNFASYFSAEYLSMVWPLLAIIISISYAGKTLAGGVESGTIGLELAQPISRTKLYLSKYLAGLIAITIFTVTTLLGVVPLAGLYDIELEIVHWLQLTGMAWLFVVAIYSLAYMCSAIFSERSRVYGVVAGVLLMMYVARIIASLEDKLDWLRSLSFFHYFEGSKILTEGSLNNAGAMVFAGTIILTIVVGAMWWNRRDLAV